MALTDKLTTIGDAVRAKTGGTEKMTLDEMATTINNIVAQEDLSVEMREQDNLITQIQSAIVGKGAGGGADIKLSKITFATDDVEYMLYGAIMDETGIMVSTNEMVEDGKVYYLPYSSIIAIESYDGDCFINADSAQSVINLISSGAGNFAMCIIGESGNINLVSASPEW